jgi:hypothetical protein
MKMHLDDGGDCCDHANHAPLKLDAQVIIANPTGRSECPQQKLAGVVETKSGIVVLDVVAVQQLVHFGQLIRIEYIECGPDKPWNKCIKFMMQTSPGTNVLSS